jgi:hypothetical protein
LLFAGCFGPVSIAFRKESPTQTTQQQAKLENRNRDRAVNKVVNKVVNEQGMGNEWAVNEQ